MVNRADNVEGGGEQHDIEEVDEVTEQLDPEILQSIRTDKLDDFLREVHDATTLSDKGMPSPSWLREHFKTKSAVIRYLHHKGHSVRDISHHLGFRYQHVRNVLTVQLKRGPNENWQFAEDEEKRISPGLDKV